MKICAIICEYNPLHNGHVYQIEQAKRLSDADKILCVMSGNFVQRGEDAVLGKYRRASHAILSGADAVVELPTLFSTSVAENFAYGAVKILSSVPSVSHLSFGTEFGTEQDFFSVANILLNEPKEISEKIKRLLDEGEGYAKAREKAYSGIIDEGFLSSPNAVLGVEYAKAVLRHKKKIRLVPIQRLGAKHDQTTSENDRFFSSSVIREYCLSGKKEKIRTKVPPYVFDDLSKSTSYLDVAEKIALLSVDKENLRKVPDCSEGLENALKKEAENATQDIVSALSGKRYTRSRIQRILLHNLLAVRSDLIKRCVNSPLYLNVLAFKNKDVLSELGKSEFPLILRAHDENTLSGAQKECFELDKKAHALYALLRNRETEKKPKL